MNGTLVKWDASVVGETPPLGRWVVNGRTIKETTKVPHSWIRSLARFVGREWVAGVDAQNHPGCLEVIHINDGETRVVFRRNA